ncbi:MAG TPA: response regulator [Herpetosiphonaceae bacterium]
MTARILVIEDSPPLLALYQALFQDEGYEVILQSTPRFDPLTIARIAPDLIVLDLLFDGHLIGWDALQALRLQPVTATIPIVICSAALRHVDVLQSAFAMLDVHVLTKPFDLETLLKLVDHLLTQHGTHPDRLVPAPPLDDQE